MVNVLTEDNGLAVGISTNKIVNDLLGHALGALVQYEHAIHVALVVDAVLDLLAEVVLHTGWGAPALEVFIEVDTDYLVGRQKAIVDALLERVGVDRLAEVGKRRDVTRLLGRGG